MAIYRGNGGSVEGITESDTVTIAISQGGTGANTAAGARTNLGLADIASTASYNDLVDVPTGVGTGTVTSVDMTVPTGLVVTGNPVTTSGTLAVALDTGYSIPTDTSQDNWDTAYGWGDHSTEGYLVNTNNLSDVSSASTARTNLGLGTIATQAASNVSITGGSVTGITDLAVADGGTGSSTASGARTNLGLVIGTDVQAYDANTAKINVVQSFSVAQRGTITALTDGTTVTPDFAAANNFSLTIGGNRTLANPTNLTAGQSGVIVITQDGTGSRTLAYGSYWKFPTGTAPTLTTTASAVDVLCYYVESSTRITARLIADVK